jgi:DNA-binding response OmpR family regulator
MDDYKLCKTIKFDKMLKNIPVILVTAFSLSHDVIRELEYGADNFICKLYDGYYLIVIIPIPFLRVLPSIPEQPELWCSS